MKDNICVHHLTSSMVRLNADDIYRARYLSDVQYNDRRILFTVTQPDRRANDYLSSVWIYEGGLRKFTVGPRDYGARWSADGSSVIFVSDRGRGEDRKDVSGLYSIRADGGEAERICEFKGKIDSPVIQKDGRGVFFLGTTKAETEKKGSDVKTVRKFPFYFNAKGFLDGRETQIYHTSLRGKISKITKGPFVISQFDVSSNRIVFAARSEEWDTYTTDLFICGLRGGRIRSITGMPAGYGSPSFSPDGRTVAFTFRNKEQDSHCAAGGKNDKLDDAYANSFFIPSLAWFQQGRGKAKSLQCTGRPRNGKVCSQSQPDALRRYEAKSSCCHCTCL